MLTKGDLEYIYQVNKEFGPIWNAQLKERHAAAVAKRNEAQKAYVSALESQNTQAWSAEVRERTAQARNDYDAAVKEWQYCEAASKGEILP